MATVRKEIITRAHPDDVWDTVRDIGALHTRLVPGFVIDTRLEPGVRVVSFADGRRVREPIVTLDAIGRRLVWSAEGVGSHYNAAVQVFAEGEGSRVVWIADFLPDDIASRINAAMEAGAHAMRAALDAVARPGT